MHDRVACICVVLVGGVLFVLLRMEVVRIVPVVVIVSSSSVVTASSVSGRILTSWAQCTKTVVRINA